MTTERSWTRRALGVGGGDGAGGWSLVSCVLDRAEQMLILRCLKYVKAVQRVVAIDKTRGRVDMQQLTCQAIQLITSGQSLTVIMCRCDNTGDSASCSPPARPLSPTCGGLPGCRGAGSRPRTCRERLVLPSLGFQSRNPAQALS